METAYLRTLQNKSHVKFKVLCYRRTMLWNSQQWLANILMSEEKCPCKTDLLVNAEELSFVFYVF